MCLDCFIFFPMIFLLLVFLSMPDTLFLQTKKPNILSCSKCLVVNFECKVCPLTRGFVFFFALKLHLMLLMLHRICMTMCGEILFGGDFNDLASYPVGYYC